MVGDLDLLAGLGNDAELERMVRLMAAAPDLSLSLRLITEEASPDLLETRRADAEAAIRKAMKGPNRLAPKHGIASMGR